MPKKNYKRLQSDQTVEKISTINQKDSKRIEKLKIFSFTPHETPLITSQQNTDLDHLNTCKIGFFNKDALFPCQLKKLQNSRDCCNELAFVQ